MATVIKNDIDLINKFQYIDSYSIRYYQNLFNTDRITTYQTIIGQDKLARLLSLLLSNGCQKSDIFSIDETLLRKTFDLIIPISTTKRKQLSHNLHVMFTWIYFDLLNESANAIRNHIPKIQRSSLLENIRDDNIEIALRLYNLNNVYFTYQRKYPSDLLIHERIKDMIIYDDISLIPEISNIIIKKLNMFKVNCRFTNLLFKWIYRNYLLKTNSDDVYYHKFLLHKIIVDVGFKPQKMPKKYDKYLTNIMIIKHPEYLNNNLVNNIFQNNDVFATNYVLHFYDNLTIDNMNNIGFINDIDQFIKIIKNRNFVPNYGTLLLACLICSVRLFDFCISPKFSQIIPDQTCVLAVVGSVQYINQMTMLKKILGYKIVFTESFFKQMIDIISKKMFIIRDFTVYLDVLINYIPKITADNVIYAITAGVNIDNPNDYGIECDEQLYFHYYKNHLPININAFKDKIDIRRLILRQKWRSRDRDVFKYMKDNNIKPDRYCSDSLLSSKRRYFIGCSKYIRSDVLSDIYRTEYRWIDYKFMTVIYDDFVI